MSNPSIPQSFRVGTQFDRRYNRKDLPSWWTPERDAKLLFVIEKFDDLDKAARVLGTTKKAACFRLADLRQQGKAPPRRVSAA